MGIFEMAVAVVPQVQYWPAVPKVGSSKLAWSFFTLLSSSFQLEELSLLIGDEWYTNLLKFAYNLCTCFSD